MPKNVSRDFAMEKRDYGMIIDKMCAHLITDRMDLLSSLERQTCKLLLTLFLSTAQLHLQQQPLRPAKRALKAGSKASVLLFCIGEADSS